MLQVERDLKLADELDLKLCMGGKFLHDFALYVNLNI